MSLFSSIASIGSKIVSAVKPYAGAIIGGAVGGPTGALLGSSMGGTSGTLPVLPGAGRVTPTGFTGRGLGAATPMTTNQLVMTGGLSRSSVSRVNRAAGTMCARYPQWCMQIGGVGAVASAMASGQLPIPRRRRRRGISPRDLSSFRRVANLIKNYSAPVHRMRHTTTARKR